MTKAEGDVRIWEEDVTIPTYPVGEPDKNPMFLEKRVYQGSSGVVYPFPVIDKIMDEKVDRAWHVVFLENEFLRLMIMPELGGRIQCAYDKTNGYPFVYHNHTIKPALVGLAGPWISGGIEFNWPQHHRPDTYAPVDFSLEEKEDGSRTCWIGDVDRMAGLRVLTGFTLKPGKAFIEISARIYNRTGLPQSFLWWANPAVAVNESYQSVFPPDVHAVYDHGKRDVSRFPIATGTYYKVDYSAGVDISRYRNIPVPTSYMAYRSKYDFVGGYDHGKGAGILHVADHHVSPGKKQWTWGTGEFGKAWERNLTDGDGPYIELMTGVFTDNQPDFTWIGPGEEKGFVQYFMPYQAIGMAKNANREAVCSLETTADRTTGSVRARLGVYATSLRPGSRIVLSRGDEVLFSERADLEPGRPFLAEASFPGHGAGLEALSLSVKDGAGRLLVSYTVEKEEVEPIPEPAKGAEAPGEIRTIEELYLTGVHLEQYRHATYSPEAYYREALKRDPGDARSNNALGLYLLRRGEFGDSVAFFQAAIARLTERNPNPASGEPWYNLGLALGWLGRQEEAFDAFYKASWSGDSQAASLFQLSRTASLLGRFREALDFALASLRVRSDNHDARALASSVLRTLAFEDAEEASSLLDRALVLVSEDLADDVLSIPSRWEKVLVLRALGRKEEAGAEEAAFSRNSGANPYAALELSFSYAASGLWDDALLVAERGIAECGKGGAAFRSGVLPQLLYAASRYSRLSGGEGGRAESARFLGLAKKAPTDYCFPNGLAMIPILEWAMEAAPEDPRAPYYLGCLFYDKRRYDRAVSLWEASERLDPGFPTVHRNLALACFNKLADPARARRELETAFSLDESDARVLLELDQLYKRIGRPPAERLAFLEGHLDCVEKRDDLFIEYVSLVNMAGDHGKALGLVTGRRFHPWEGGEGKATAQYTWALVGIAGERLGEGDQAGAASALERALELPESLGEAKLVGAKDNMVHYLLGRVLEDSGRREEAEREFEAATAGSGELGSVMFYNDQPAYQALYQALAFARLGMADRARGLANRLVDTGERRVFDEPRIDYFAVSLPDFLIFDEDLGARNRVFCRFLMALGSLALGDGERALRELGTVLALDPAHQEALVHRELSGLLLETGK